MALLWFDGFEGYNSYTDLELAGYSADSPNNFYSSDARTGTKCIRSYDPVSKSIKTNSEDTFIFGFGLKINALSESLFRIFNSSTSAADIFIDVSSGFLRLCRASTSYVLATSSLAINPGVWYFFEAKVQISNSTTITCSFKINNVEALTLASGADTLYSSALTDHTIFQFYSNTISTPYVLYDDFYICDSSGSVNNDFLGPIRVDTIYPNANGNSSDWDGSDGNQVDNYQLVDESPVSESDYVEAQNINEKDLYGYGALNYGVGAIHGVKTVSVIGKTTSAIGTYKHVCRSNSTDYDGGEFTTDFDIIFASQLWETDPDTSSAWGLTALNAAEFGIKVYS